MKEGRSSNGINQEETLDLRSVQETLLALLSTAHHRLRVWRRDHAVS